MPTSIVFSIGKKNVCNVLWVKLVLYFRNKRKHQDQRYYEQSIVLARFADMTSYLELGPNLIEPTLDVCSRKWYTLLSLFRSSFHFSSISEIGGKFEIFVNIA